MKKPSHNVSFYSLYLLNKVVCPNMQFLVFANIFLGWAQPRLDYIDREDVFRDRNEMEFLMP